MDKRTLIVVGSSTAIGFIGDVATYSVAASKDGTGKFKIVFPKGKDLVAVLFLGVVGGFVIDYSLKIIEESMKTKEEKLLDNLFGEEKRKLAEGRIVGKTPTGVIWS
ncbi:MAG: hypothetical protein FJZ56_02795 [Chlamydiae bacterium]|nr:hypothetical protein [Chlamydiota bacterium]